jgi:hypothetical protein
VRAPQSLRNLRDQTNRFFCLDPSVALDLVASVSPSMNSMTR